MQCTFFRPFNLHLDFWKSRSASNLRKTSGPANLEFFLGLHLEKKKKNCTINLKKNPGDKLKKSRCAGPEIFLKFETDLNFSRPWFSEIKLQIKRPKVSLKLPLINFKCRCRMHFTYQRGNKWDMWGLRSPLFSPKINKLFFYFTGLTTFMLCTWKLEPSCCKKCQKKSQPRNWFKE